jgi:prolyl oligopeptidase
MNRISQLSALGLTCAAMALAGFDPVNALLPAHSQPTTNEASMTETTTEDAFEWLEEVEGEAPLNTVRAWNERSLNELMSDPRFEALQADALAIVNAQDKIAYGAYRGGFVYNFWQDEKNTRGLLRRTSLESYQTDAPAWEVLLDVDALTAAESANWVYRGTSCLSPDYTRCIMTLSDGGKDASERREWDHTTKSFVDGGFYLPEAKAGTAWADADTLLVGTDWGNDTMTESGYPFVVKSLKRGQKLEEATELFRGAKGDVGVWPFVLETDDGARLTFVSRAVTFYESEVHWLKADGTTQAMPIPRKSSPRAVFKGQMVLTIEEDWTPVEGGPSYPKGALLSFDFDAYRATGAISGVKVIYEPGPRSSIEGVSRSLSKLLVTAFENVTGAAYAYDYDGNAWTRQRLALPENGSVGIVSAEDTTDIVFANAESFIAPDTLYKLDMNDLSIETMKSAPARFDADNLVVEQFEATSSDGEQIPYFVVRDKNIAYDGTNPTLLYGYGGFQVSLNPSYSGLRGKLWLEQGGIFVLANIRGGGEFGPKWHQAGLKTNRQIIYDDFVAVAEDLIAKDITSPRHLGIMGGSNGGLLMGVMYTQRPDLWNAVVCQVPLLDMLRYHKLLAGASWMGEYGDPDIAEERAFLKQISPYHNIDPAADYPDIFFVTSTKDDRVHPGHARKMAAKLEEAGKPFLYYENIDGGHSAAANLKETAKRVALEYTFLFQRLSGE